MDYLRIEEDGTLHAVLGKDPETDEELLQETYQGTLSVVRYRGNQFEELSVEDVGEEDNPAFDCTWTAVPVE